MYFHVYCNLQIHAHIYRSFIRHHKMPGVRIAKRKIEPQKSASPCSAKLCACIFFVNTLQQKQVVLSKTTCFCNFLPYLPHHYLPSTLTISPDYLSQEDSFLMSNARLDRVPLHHTIQQKLIQPPVGTNRRLLFLYCGIPN